MTTRIPIKKYVLDPAASWEERHSQLEAHHVEEVTFLAERIKALEIVIAKAKNVKRGCECDYDYRCLYCTYVVALQDALAKLDSSS